VNVIPCRQYLCPPHSRATCFQTKSVTSTSTTSSILPCA
jgi:hypothetical protein